MTVISSFDLSASWGPTSFQGDRPTCLAFAASELNRDLSGSDSALSAEYIYRAAARKSATWTAGAGLLMTHVSEALGQSEEESRQIAESLRQSVEHALPGWRITIVGSVAARNDELHAG